MDINPITVDVMIPQGIDLSKDTYDKAFKEFNEKYNQENAPHAYGEFYRGDTTNNPIKYTTIDMMNVAMHISNIRTEGTEGDFKVKADIHPSPQLQSMIESEIPMRFSMRAIARDKKSKEGEFMRLITLDVAPDPQG